MELKKQKEDLNKLSRFIEKGIIPRADYEWGGADVVITQHIPEKSEKNFYPDPRYVVTSFSFELSWLFNQLKKIFHHLIDGTTKIEFYGRLANAAIFYLSKGGKDCKELLFSVLHEAYAMLEEMEEGDFKYLPIAIGNEIYKEIEEGEKSGYIGVEETKKFFEQILKGGSNE
jgi:hypothetical protein